jgi:Na+/H+ antiporter NhaD/arsenite permease-like protein
MYQLLSPEIQKWVVLGVFVAVFALVLYRKVPIYILSLAGAALLVLLGIVHPGTALSRYINWDVLALYLGYGILSVALQESHLPNAIADWILPRLRKEKFAIFFLCALAAALSSFMPNPVVVLMLAPLAIEIANRLKASLFLYLVCLAIASNVVTTVTMVADPPAIILAMQTNLSFLDFYWYKGRPGLGTLSVAGVLAALSSLLFQFRNLNNKVDIQLAGVEVPRSARIIFGSGIVVSALAVLLSARGLRVPALLVLGAWSLLTALLHRIERSLQRGKTGKPGTLHLSLAASALFVLSVIALALVPNIRPPGVFGFLNYLGWVGLAVGVLSAVLLGKKWKEAMKEQDWLTVLFLVGIFIVIGAVDQVGLLKDFSSWMIGAGFNHPFVVFTIITWLSVALSSFIDNVPYTVLMIPVCSYLAQALGVSPFYLYFGMLVGTGIGGNITPVGATANVLACGMLEKRGYKIHLGRYMRISVPFSCAAVLVVQILVQLFWG